MSRQLHNNSSNVLLPSVEASLDLVRNSSCHLRRTPDIEWLHEIDKIQENIPHIFSFLDALQKAEFAVGLWRWYEARAKFQEGSILLLRAAANIGDLPFTLKMEASTALGVLNGKTGKYTLACQHFAIAARTADFLRTPSDKAHIFHFHGQTLRQMGDLDSAAKKHEAALALWCDLGDTWGVATAHGGLGVVCWARGDADGAQDHYSRSAKGYEACRDMRQAARMLSNLATIASGKGDQLSALKSHKTVLGIMRKLNDVSYVANCLNNIGDVYRKMRRYEEAQTFLLESLKTAREIGYNNASLFAVCSLAKVAAACKDAKNTVLLYSAFDVLGRSEFLPIAPADKAQMVLHLDCARKALGRQRFSIFWNRIQRLEPVAIIEGILTSKVVKHASNTS